MGSKKWSTLQEYLVTFKEFSPRQAYTLLRVHEPNPESCPPLHLAVLSENVECVDFFLRQGVNLDARACHEESALHWACKSGSVPIVEALLKAKADPLLEDKDHNTPLHWGCEYDHPRVVKLLLRYAGTPALEKLNIYGRTPMEEALFHSSDRTALLIKRVTRPTTCQRFKYWFRR